MNRQRQDELMDTRSRAACVVQLFYMLERQSIHRIWRNARQDYIRARQSEHQYFSRPRSDSQDMTRDLQEMLNSLRSLRELQERDSYLLRILQDYNRTHQALRWMVGY